MDAFHALLLIGGNLVASALSVAAGVGGGPLMLVLMAGVLPIATVVPLHCVLMLGATTARLALFRAHVRRDVAVPFLAGAPLGALLGTQLYVALPERLIAGAIGTLMLVAVWMPRLEWRPPLRHPFFVVGVVQAFVSAVIGFGALLQTVVLHSRLSRLEITGTLGCAFTGLNLFKLGGFMLAGFAFGPYVAVLVPAVIAGAIGSWLGMRIAHRLSEAHFRLAFKVVLTLGALRILYRAVLG